MKTQSSSHQGITRRDAMKSGIGAASLAAMAPERLFLSQYRQHRSSPLTRRRMRNQTRASAQVTQPATASSMQPGYARTIAQTAYVWGWPMVNMLSRKARITQAPRPGLLGGILPGRAARPAWDAARLHRAVGNLRHLPEPGRRLWPRVLLAR